MDRPRQYNCKWNKSEKDKPYDFSMWNLRNKTKIKRKIEKKKHQEALNYGEQFIVTRGEVGRRMAETGDGN